MPPKPTTWGAKMFWGGKPALYKIEKKIKKSFLFKLRRASKTPFFNLV